MAATRTGLSGPASNLVRIVRIDRIVRVALLVHDGSGPLNIDGIKTNCFGNGFFAIDTLL